MKTAETIKLPLSSQTWVTFTSTRHGLILLQPQEPLYENYQVLASNGTADRSISVFMVELNSLKYVVKSENQPET